MAHTLPTAASSSSSSSSNFQLLINNALDTYTKRTRKDLRAHPLAAQLQACDSPTSIIAVLQQQVQGLDQSRSTDERWTKWLDPTINVLLTFSRAVGTVGLAFSPASVIFAGVGVLLSAAKDVRASHDNLLDIFERIEKFFRRLEVYTEAQPTAELMDIIIEIIVEVLSILGIATKEIEQSRIKKFGKKLIGRTEIEDALRRLDKLTHEEAWMGIAQNLKAAHAVGERVGAVDDKVAEVIRDGKEVKVVLQQTATDVDQVKVAAQQTATDVDQVKVVTQQTATDVDLVKVATQQTATDVDQMKRTELRKNIHKWLSPPDASTNHNIACSTYHKKPASWFFQGSIFQEWKSTGSLLWLHGKPGSGKSVLCSTVIQDIEAMCEDGMATMAYFYFDFRDANKQGLRDLVPSLLTQLSASSDSRCDILSDLYLANGEGEKQPADSNLVECLKQMLTLADQSPTYLIIDALDESSNSSGIPSPRERVLHLLKELVELHLPNLHICVTSRPEIEIRDVLEPLTSCGESRRVSLHDQTGQREDIVDYVKSVVYSNTEPIMRRWRTEDKELVIKVLSERADGMFRWVFCQLEVLRHCLPPSVRPTLDELPETLDETYKRVLKEIKKPNRVHAIRLLQCLVVAIRPLQVKELAEVLAIDFGDEERMPKLNPNWRWGDEEQALLASCSSLIAIVESDESRVVQFSHYSVKEYLTSARLATSSGDISRYHIDLEPAHTILAQACIGVLLQSGDRVEEGGGRKICPLARYAAQYWVAHAQVQKVSSCIRKAMEYLFDVDKPCFAAWLEVYDIDTITSEGSTFSWFTPSKSSATPLYYAARFGFQYLVEHLVARDPKQVNDTGGYYVTPLVAALEAGHSQIAEFLYQNGAHPNVRGDLGRTPLISAACHGDVEMVQILLKYKADVHAQDNHNSTPLHFAAGAARFGRVEAMRVLLEHGTGVNARKDDDTTPLHNAARDGTVEAVHLLLEHGADVNARKNDDTTPLHEATLYGRVEAIRMLLEHGADLNARNNDDATPLHVAALYGRVEAIYLLLRHGADVDARKDDTTPLYEAIRYGRIETIRLLLENGADVNARKNDDTTPLHEAVQLWTVKAMRVLLEHGADVNARENDDTTPLHVAAYYERVEAIRVLLEHGADVNARKDDTTPMHEAIRYGRIEAIHLLLEYGADVNARENDHITPLHVAAQYERVEAIHVLLEHGADVNARKNDDTTPLHDAVQLWTVEAMRVLLKHGADVNARKNDDTTPLHVAAQLWTVEAMRVLLEHGADVNARKNDGTTPLHVAAQYGMLDGARVGTDTDFPNPDLYPRITYPYG